MKNNYHIIPKETIESRIFLIRGQKVMIDRDLAFLYGVETKYLNRQVRQNKKRFPVEFMFQLTSREKIELVTNCHRFKTMKHSATLPFAFTEHGVARKIERHDEDIRSLFDAIRELMSPPSNPKKQIGFTAKEKRARYAVAVK